MAKKIKLTAIVFAGALAVSSVKGNYVVADRDAYTNANSGVLGYTKTNLPVEVNLRNLNVPLTSNSCLALTACDVVSTNQPGTVGVTNYLRAPLSGQTLTIDVPVVVQKLLMGNMPKVIPVRAQVNDTNIEFMSFLEGIGSGNIGVTNDYLGTNFYSAGVSVEYNDPNQFAFTGLKPSPLKTSLDSVPELGGTALVGLVVAGALADKRIRKRR